jgi:hypothetical protein
MSCVICQKHGRRIAPLLCRHLREAMDRRAPLPELFYVEAWYLGEPAWSHYVCPDCARSNGITDNPTVWRDDEALDRLFAMNDDVAPVCPVCLDEAKAVA